MCAFVRDVLHPREIGVILSYRCLSDCAHCLYNSGPNWRDWMDEDEVGAALRTAKKVWGSGFQLHFTGGEPFLHFPLLRASVQIAVDLDIPCYVETNASWCRDQQKVGDRFRQLREVGLDAVLISVSPFHQESIPLKHTLDAISIARSVFGDNRVIVYQSDWLPEMSRHGVDGPVPLDVYQSEYGANQAGLHLWLGYGLISGGRAGYRLGNLVPKRKAEAFHGVNCQAELLFAPHSHLDLYGNYIPGFCGGITLGDWHDLEALIEGYGEDRYPTLIRLLIERGPFGLYQKAVGAYAYQPLPDGYAGKCHLCVDVRKHLLESHLFEETLKPHKFYESF